VLQIANGTHVKVSSSITVLLMATLVTRANIQTLEPQSTNERLNPECGKLNVRYIYPNHLCQ